MTEYNLSYVINKNNIIIKLSGEIDFSNYDTFREELFNYIDNTVTDKVEYILFDLENTILISSNGWGIFFELFDTLKKRNLTIDIRFCKLNTIMLEVANALKFFDEFELVSDE